MTFSAIKGRFNGCSCWVIMGTSTLYLWKCLTNSNMWEEGSVPCGAWHITNSSMIKSPCPSEPFFLHSVLLTPLALPVPSPGLCLTLLLAVVLSFGKHASFLPRALWISLHRVLKKYQLTILELPLASEILMSPQLIICMVKKTYPERYGDSKMPLWSAPTNT